MRRTAVLAAVTAALAAGCGTNTAPDTTAPYVGTWQIASGQETVDCGPGPGAPEVVTGSVVVSTGAAHNTLSVRDTNHGNCVWLLDAGAATATFRAGDPCGSTTAVEDASGAAITPRDYVFTLTAADAATVTSRFDFTALGTTCAHASTETLARAQ
jgi:hypothetical protein